MDEAHKHIPVEGVVLDAEGHPSADHWYYCSVCGAHLGDRAALAPMPAMGRYLTAVPG